MPAQEGVAKERQQIFNNIAPVYDQLNDLLSLGLHRSWKARTRPRRRYPPRGFMLNTCLMRLGPSALALNRDRVLSCRLALRAHC